ncbi:hypothetical protein FSARC_13352 [Fusarium sarcochroum]|uniref:F-box domain-containing protein n=1 Tax=Fusarium sarcochroum TaxID=1208366 RepID=A0A8H4T297_9HYPO|nr:hypothetical protein FSARC_13352 [Fusarium sarcochroum]
MDKLPQECREHIASFLGKEALNNLVLVSKNYAVHFTGSNLRRIRFQGSVVPISHKLKSFLAAKSNRKHQVIRKVSIVLDSERSHSGSSRNVPLSDATAYYELVPLLVNTLSRMTGLRGLSLAAKRLSDEKAHEFSVLLAPTQKWDKVKSLKISGPTDVVCAVLDHCDAKALETVHLCKRTDSPEYSALKSMYPTYSLQYSLKELCLWYQPPPSY